MKQILIKSGIFNEEQTQKLMQLAGGANCRVVSGDIPAEVLQTANAVIGNLSVDQLAQCPRLEWLQLNSSGADAYVKTDKLHPGTVITTATGAYGIGIAEYMVAMLLGMMKKIPTYLANQKAAVWKDEGMVTTPTGKRVLIVGTGNIGMEFARRIRPFGAEVVGVRRRAGECPPELDGVYGMEQLKEQLALADVVALCLPGTAETLHLMDAEMLSACKQGAYLMNVGRGNVIPLDALLDASVTERFAGIWVDVCEIEPLPDGHPLFAVPNLLVTPHITGGFHLDLTMSQIFDICCHNLKAWLGEGEFRSVLDRSTGYCK